MNKPTKAEIEACLRCVKPASACNACSGPHAASRGARGYPRETVEAALALFDAGERVAEIARLLGVSQGAVNLWIRRRKTEHERNIGGAE